MSFPIPQVDDTAERTANLVKVKATLKAFGPRIQVEFVQSNKNLWNMVGDLKDGLHSADSMQIVVLTRPKDLLALRVYPRTPDGYIDINRAKDPVGLMSFLLHLNDHGYFHWGLDNDGDVFAQFQFGLQGDYPEEAFRNALSSVAGLDPFVAGLRLYMENPPSAPGGEPTAKPPANPSPGE